MNATMLEKTQFAAEDDCKLVIASYERCRATHSHSVGDGFFDHRVLWINSFPDEENNTRRILQRWRHLAVQLISTHVGQPVYSDTIQVVRWDGQAMPPHQDDRHPDGRLHNTPWRTWASVIYLNGDFEGGELYFPETNYNYKPSTGTLMVFEGRLWHGVRAVTQGVRYTSPSWYSIDAAHEDTYARLEY
jgi:predicted 2-oxoglutarate/Fe(II)-dependent dioxygenase YbiX